jgi:hypothetical protein
VDSVGGACGAADSVLEAAPGAGVDGGGLRDCIGEQEGGADGVGRGEVGGGDEVASVKSGEAIVAVGG